MPLCVISNLSFDTPESSSTPLNTFGTGTRRPCRSRRTAYTLPMMMMMMPWLLLVFTAPQVKVVPLTLV